MATHSSILAWRIPWTDEPRGVQCMGSQGIGHDRVTNATQPFILLALQTLLTLHTSNLIISATNQLRFTFQCLLYLLIHTSIIFGSQFCNSISGLLQQHPNSTLCHYFLSFPIYLHFSPDFLQHKFSLVVFWLQEMQKVHTDPS